MLSRESDARRLARPKRPVRHREPCIPLRHERLSRGMSRHLRIAAVTIALFAMITHALVPLGWMPGSAGMGHAAALVPCDGHHAMEMQGPAKPKPKHENSHRQDVCPFGAASHFAQAANLPSLIPRTLEFAAVQQFANTPQVSTAARLSPHSARAPPELV